LTLLAKTSVVELWTAAIVTALFLLFNSPTRQSTSRSLISCEELSWNFANRRR